MNIDIELFHEFESGKTKSPTLRFYSWSNPCISLGYSQDPDKELFLDKCREQGIEVVKRPTGGGIVFHNEYELTYSLICNKDDTRLPKGLIGSYMALSKVIIESLRSLNVPAENTNSRHNRQARLCFSFPASYEIVLKGHKIVGSAQKRGKNALLQQGSIFIRSIEYIMGENIDRKALIKHLSTGFTSLLS